MAKSGAQTSGLCVAVAIVALAGWKGWRTAPRGWAVYHNERWGFCVAYPPGWAKAEPLDGSGVELERGEGPANLELNHISIGGLPNQPSPADESRLQNVEENFDWGLDALKQYEYADELRVLEKHKVVFAGYPAIVATLSYKDARTGSTWKRKDISFITRDQVVFSLDLKCRPGEFPLLEPVFDEVARSFRLNCRARRLVP